MVPVWDASSVTSGLIAAGVVLTAIAVWTDIRWGKVLNAVTVPFAALGLVLNTVGGGWDGLLLSIGGVGMGFVLWLASRLAGRILGGGDIKLLMALGALLGPVFVLWTFVVGALLGGILAITLALRRGRLQSALRQMAAGVYARAAVAAPMEIGEGSGELRLPYAVALSAGAWLVMGYGLWGSQW
ncbi:MAG: prepilin peptidase [Armatimonadota bacterium]